MKPPAKYVLTPSLELGYAPFDDQHRDLIARLNAIDRRAADNGGIASIADLREFAAAFIDHMEREVDILRAFSYPDVEAHTAQHDKLAAEVEAFLARHEAAPADREAVSHLAWCLLEDAIKEDLKAKYFLCAKAR